MLQQKLSRFWWLANRRYCFYMLREITGPVIAAYALYILGKLIFRTLAAPVNTAPALGYFTDGSLFGYYFGIVALVFSVIHSLTWFFVSGKLAAPGHPLLARLAGIILIFVWLGVSILLILSSLPAYLQFYGR